VDLETYLEWMHQRSKELSDSNNAEGDLFERFADFVPPPEDTEAENILFDLEDALELYRTKALDPEKGPIKLDTDDLCLAVGTEHPGTVRWNLNGRFYDVQISGPRIRHRSSKIQQAIFDETNEGWSVQSRRVPEFQPCGTPFRYESTLSRDQLILIGDFGGGTSDFSLLRVGPTILRAGRTDADLLGNAGVGFAGDAFDAKIIRHLVAPALGARSEMRSMDKILSVPSWVYAKLERWHHLSFLKTRDVIEMLRSVEKDALEPAKIDALIHVVKEGYWIPIAPCGPEGQI